MNNSPLNNVYWLGGSPCSGKSSIAERLVQKCDLHYYSCDKAFFRHMKYIDPERQPTFAKITSLSGDNLWMRPVTELISDEVATYQEEFEMILSDLHTLPPGLPILAEGAALMPALVAPYLVEKAHYAAVVPTPEFQLFHYRQRTWAAEHLKDCQNPEQAFMNWMERDMGFAKLVIQQAAETDLSVLVVDGKFGIDQNYQWVAGQFLLA